MPQLKRMTRTSVLAATMGLLLAACGDGPIGPSPLTDIPGPSFSLTADDGLTAVDGPPQVLTLCKVGEEGAWAEFSVSKSVAGPEGGELLLGSTVVVDAIPHEDVPPGCVEIWRAQEPRGDDPIVEITVTETASSPGTTLVSVNTFSMDGEAHDSDPTGTVVVRVSYDNGAFIKFTNEGGDDISPPSGGAEGCTPGFWRNNPEQWPAPYTPTTLFSDVFADAFPEMTLMQAVRQGGGQWRALGRHTVAALLNAQNPDVEFGMTAAEVIDAFNDAWNVTDDWEGTKDQLEALNERGCPLSSDRANGNSNGNS